MKSFLLGDDSGWARFDGDLHGRALLEFHFVALFVGEAVLNADFFIERVGPLLNIYLRLFGLTRVGRLDDSLDGSRQCDIRLFRHTIS
jgi:hypothetical protein